MADVEKDDSIYTIESEDKMGYIQIADDVVSSIAAIAITEVDGVSRLTGNIPTELIAKLGKRNLAKSVRIAYDNDSVKVDASIQVKFGYNIVDVSKAVQEKVKSALSLMTGLECSSVNVRVSGIDFNEDK